MEIDSEETTDKSNSASCEPCHPSKKRRLESDSYYETDSPIAMELVRKKHKLLKAFRHHLTIRMMQLYCMEALSDPDYILRIEDCNTCLEKPNDLIEEFFTKYSTENKLEEFLSILYKSVDAAQEQSYESQHGSQDGSEPAQGGVLVSELDDQFLGQSMLPKSIEDRTVALHGHTQDRRAELHLGKENEGAPVKLAEKLQHFNRGAAFSPNVDKTSGLYTSHGTTSKTDSVKKLSISPKAPKKYSEKMKAEASIIQRISELQKEGMWYDKRLPKVAEVPKPKTHWDYLLEEMTWLAGDFATERKWKRSIARKCARMIEKYFNDKEAAIQRAEREEESRRRRLAGYIAKGVLNFWSNAQSLVKLQEEGRIASLKRKALDDKLSFIVGQTEKYSVMLKDRLADINNPHPSEPEQPDNRDGISDGEFNPDSDSEMDDEETIAKAEKEDSDVDNEISQLTQESSMPLDDFLQQLPKDYIDAMLGEFRTTSPGRTLSRSDKTSEKDSDDESIVCADSNDDYCDSEKEDEVDSEQNEGLASLLKTCSPEKAGENHDVELNSVAAMAESILPKGNTLSSTKVVTKIPILLKHPLREYQHIGLDWLVTMYEKKLNGILADEMGLGKTIQTIALLAHLACEKANWGPHLIVVPTSVMLNWEMEFKKWCPGFKILTYYGTQKERKMKRIGWTKVNTFHVCITSYKLVTQDHQSFRRKRWKYLILDEAQNIKNFKSQRWQLLLNFNTQRRLLLTGTPLQNNLMELWSLMHFLMPNVFQSHREFREWFSNPVTGMVEGNAQYNENIIKRLHQVLRPFILRRLKHEVEKQLPKKYEHMVLCRLSKRQRFLYEEFMSRSKTRDTLSSGNLLNVLNALMQLRKVCNHPNLFEPRPIVSPFHCEGIEFLCPSLVYNMSPKSHILEESSYSLARLTENEMKFDRDICHVMKKLEWKSFPSLVIRNSEYLKDAREMLIDRKKLPDDAFHASDGRLFKISHSLVPPPCPQLRQQIPFFLAKVNPGPLFEDKEFREHVEKGADRTHDIMLSEDNLEPLDDNPEIMSVESVSPEVICESIAGEEGPTFECSGELQSKKASKERPDILTPTEEVRSVNPINEEKAGKEGTCRTSLESCNEPMPSDVGADAGGKDIALRNLGQRHKKAALNSSNKDQIDSLEPLNAVKQISQRDDIPHKEKNDDKNADEHIDGRHSKHIESPQPDKSTSLKAPCKDSNQESSERTEFGVTDHAITIETSLPVSTNNVSPSPSSQKSSSLSSRLSNQTLLNPNIDAGRYSSEDGEANIAVSTLEVTKSSRFEDTSTQISQTPSAISHDSTKIDQCKQDGNQECSSKEKVESSELSYQTLNSPSTQGSAGSIDAPIEIGQSMLASEKVNNLETEATSECSKVDSLHLSPTGSASGSAENQIRANQITPTRQHQKSKKFEFSPTASEDSLSSIYPCGTFPTGDPMKESNLIFQYQNTVKPQYNFKTDPESGIKKLWMNPKFCLDRQYPRCGEDSDESDFEPAPFRGYDDDMDQDGLGFRESPCKDWAPKSGQFSKDNEGEAVLEGMPGLESPSKVKPSPDTGLKEESVKSKEDDGINDEAAAEADTVTISSDSSSPQIVKVTNIPPRVKDAMEQGIDVIEEAEVSVRNKIFVELHKKNLVSPMILPDGTQCTFDKWLNYSKEGDGSNINLMNDKKFKRELFAVNPPEKQNKQKENHIVIDLTDDASDEFDSLSLMEKVNGLYEALEDEDVGCLYTTMPDLSVKPVKKTASETLKSPPVAIELSSSSSSLDLHSKSQEFMHSGFLYRKNTTFDAEKMKKQVQNMLGDKLAELLMENKPKAPEFEGLTWTHARKMVLDKQLRNNLMQMVNVAAVSKFASSFRKKEQDPQATNKIKVVAVSKTRKMRDAEIEARRTGSYMQNIAKFLKNATAEKEKSSIKSSENSRNPVSPPTINVDLSCSEKKGRMLSPSVSSPEQGISCKKIKLDSETTELEKDTSEVSVATKTQSSPTCRDQQKPQLPSYTFVCSCSQLDESGNSKQSTGPVSRENETEEYDEAVGSVAKKPRLDSRFEKKGDDKSDRRETKDGSTGDSIGEPKGKFDSSMKVDTVATASCESRQVNESKNQSTITSTQMKPSDLCPTSLTSEFTKVGVGYSSSILSGTNSETFENASSANSGISLQNVNDVIKTQHDTLITQSQTSFKTSLLEDTPCVDLEDDDFSIGSVAVSRASNSSNDEDFASSQLGQNSSFNDSDIDVIYSSYDDPEAKKVPSASGVKASEDDESIPQEHVEHSSDEEERPGMIGSESVKYEKTKQNGQTIFPPELKTADLDSLCRRKAFKLNFVDVDEMFKLTNCSEEVVQPVVDVQYRCLMNRGIALTKLHDLNKRRTDLNTVFGQRTLKLLKVRCDSCNAYCDKVNCLVHLQPWSLLRRNYRNCGFFQLGSNEVQKNMVIKGSGCPECVKNSTILNVNQSSALTGMLTSVEERIELMNETLSRFLMYVPGAASPGVYQRVYRPAHHCYIKELETRNLTRDVIKPLFSLYHPIINAMNTQFPDARLIQYDCGKLQVLDTLLRKLKANSHRVLIFTQMAKMLDVLEAFLNYHGHIYLRLDGATRIEERQILMEKFNSDMRIFCFILSTRSGGIGVNLTGADTVIFYDSDWNPTMDAQAQDRCHRIGQTRDVHIYRLVSEKTIEENILKRSNQKRLLGELAIEGGHFTTAFFRQNTIHEIFNVDDKVDVNKRMAEVLDPSQVNSEPEVLEADIGLSNLTDFVTAGKSSHSKTELFMSALNSAEDETDAQAARTVCAEAAAEAAEFEEEISFEEDGSITQHGMDPDKEMKLILELLLPVERLAVKRMQDTIDDWSSETVAEAQNILERNKMDWEVAKGGSNPVESEGFGEYDDISCGPSGDQLWGPPTPPLEVNDVYIDCCHSYLYDRGIMPESSLPSIFVPPACPGTPVPQAAATSTPIKPCGPEQAQDQEKWKSKTVSTSSDNLWITDPPSLSQTAAQDKDEPAMTTAKKIQKSHKRDDAIFAPRSLFDKPSPQMAKLRKDYQLKKIGRPSSATSPAKSPLGPGSISFPIAQPKAPTGPPPPDPLEWFVAEDNALLQAIHVILDLPLSLFVVNLAQTPNWDFAAELVNSVSRTTRTAKQCKWRYENVVGPREEGRLIQDTSSYPPSPPSKKKKTKAFIKIAPPSPSKAARLIKTSQLMAQDNNSQQTNLLLSKFETIKGISNKRCPTSKPMTINPHTKSTKQTSIFMDYGINYDVPVSAAAVAQARFERIQMERRKHIENSVNRATTITSEETDATTSSTTSTIISTSVDRTPAVQQQIINVVAAGENGNKIRALSTNSPGIVPIVMGDGQTYNALSSQLAQRRQITSSHQLQVPLSKFLSQQNQLTAVGSQASQAVLTHSVQVSGAQSLLAGQASSLTRSPGQMQSSLTSQPQTVVLASFPQPVGSSTSTVVNNNSTGNLVLTSKVANATVQLSTKTTPTVSLQDSMSVSQQQRIQSSIIGTSGGQQPTIVSVTPVLGANGQQITKLIPGGTQGTLATLVQASPRVTTASALTQGAAGVQRPLHFQYVKHGTILRPSTGITASQLTQVKEHQQGTHQQIALQQAPTTQTLKRIQVVNTSNLPSSTGTISSQQPTFTLASISAATSVPVQVMATAQVSSPAALAAPASSQISRASLMHGGSVANTSVAAPQLATVVSPNLSRNVQLFKQTVGGKLVTRTVSELEVQALLKQGLGPQRFAIANQAGQAQISATKSQLYPASHAVLASNVMKVQQSGGGSQLATIVKSPNQGNAMAFPVQLSQVKTVGKVGVTKPQVHPMLQTQQQPQLIIQQRRQAHPQATATKVGQGNLAAAQLIVQTGGAKQVQNSVGVQQYHQIFKPVSGSSQLLTQGRDVVGHLFKPISVAGSGASIHSSGTGTASVSAISAPVTQAATVTIPHNLGAVSQTGHSRMVPLSNQAAAKSTIQVLGSGGMIGSLTRPTIQNTSIGSGFASIKMSNHLPQNVSLHGQTVSIRIHGASSNPITVTSSMGNESNAGGGATIISTNPIAVASNVSTASTTTATNTTESSSSHDVKSKSEDSSQ